MIYRKLHFLLVFINFIVQCYCSTETYWNETLDTSSQIIPIIPNNDIYKCVSYTTAHVDVSHWINQDFSIYKDCQTSGLYTLNRIDRQFKIEIDVQRSWIVETSAIIFNGTIKPICGLNSHNFALRPTQSCADNETDRFETKNGEPLHFNINIWQAQADADSSYGLCTGDTCSSNFHRNTLTDDLRSSSYPDNVVELICDIYIDNYLNTTGREPWQRSLHYNRTIQNARQACIADVQREDWPHTAGGSVEVLFVEEQVNSDEIKEMGDIQRNFHTNLEDKLVKLAETIDKSRIDVNDMLAKITTTTSTTIITDTDVTSQFTSTTSSVYSTNSSSEPSTSSLNSTTEKPSNNSLGIIIGCSVGGAVLLIGLLIGVYCCIKKSNRKQIATDNEYDMNERRKVSGGGNITFYDGTSKVPICTIFLEGDFIESDDPVRCAQRAPCDNGAYLNVYVWLPKTLADKSTESDQVGNQSLNQMVTRVDARAICKTYVDTYMNKINSIPSQLDAFMNTTVEYVMNTCMEDFISTGDLEIARASLDVLMIKKLTRGVTSIDAIQRTMETDAQDALANLKEAIERAETIIRRIYNKTDIRVPCNPLTPPLILSKTTTTTTTTTPTTTTTASAHDEEPLHFCEAVTDPHIKTWHSPSTYSSTQHHQNCYFPGMFPIVRNNFVYFQVLTNQKFMCELTLMFSDGTTVIPICTLVSQNFEIYGDSHRCGEHGITWNTTRSGAFYFMTISYTKARFSTTIEHNGNLKNPRHYNIYTWLPASLARNSTGLCTKFDKDCQLTIRTSISDLEDDSIQDSGRTFRQSQAQTICQTYVNAYMNKLRLAPYQRSVSMNNSIASVLTDCEADVIFSGIPEVAQSSVSALMMEHVTKNAVSIELIQTAIQSNGQQALVELEDAIEDAQTEVAEIFGFTTTTKETTSTTTTTTTASTTTVTTTEATTTAPVPLASYKCAIYQDMYVQTWHPTNQASPPTRSCLGTTGNFELVRNKYVRFTFRTNGSVIEELTLRLIDDQSSNVICTVSIADHQPGWMDCEKNGINPSLITTATHETLTVYYAEANFTAIVTRDIGIYIGRFNINVYLNPELAVHSTGICHLTSSCTGSTNAQPKQRFRRNIS
ncbi:hypothetical protein I4U23_012224 [Adineta vaga]|nr:hypothetical protein I4U23_012224 [Adineta vaga]